MLRASSGQFISSRRQQLVGYASKNDLPNLKNLVETSKKRFLKENMSRVIGSAAYNDSLECLEYLMKIYSPPIELCTAIFVNTSRYAKYWHILKYLVLTGADWRLLYPQFQTKEEVLNFLEISSI